MNIHRPSCAVAIALMATQVLGPTVLWAADQRGIRIEANRRVVIAAMSGDQLALQNGEGTKALHFREAVNVGDQLTTDDRTVADVLIGNRAVVTLGQGTRAQFTTVSDAQTSIQVTKGIVRVAAAPSALGPQGLVTIRTPTGQVQTRGGIVRVLVDQPTGVAEYEPIGESKLYLASYSPSTTVAAVTPRSETIQVEEGSAEILVGNDSKTMIVPAGQTVIIQSGQAGPLAKWVSHDRVYTGILATAGHSQTPKEGVDNLVGRQVAQATALGNALTGAAETGKGEAGKKEDNKNVINGATGGVALASNSLVNSLFGGGGTANPGSGGITDRSGAGFGGNNNAGFGEASADGVALKVNGANALLVFTRKDPVQSYVKEDITLKNADGLGASAALTGGTTDFIKDDACSEACLKSHYFEAQKANAIDDQLVIDPLGPIPENVGYRPLPSVESRFMVVKELVLVGGTPNTGHGGIAPTETLVVRGAAPGPGAVGSFTNVADSENFFGLYPTDRLPADIGAFFPTPSEIVKANSTFVVETSSRRDEDIIGGTLGQYSNLATPSPNGIAIDQLGSGVSHVDGAITATSSSAIPIVKLTGGVTLDQKTQATIGTTDATNNYYTADATRKSTLQRLGATFTGSLLSVIDGPTGPTAVTVKDRLLGVYDGSTVTKGGGNKALLSVLDAKLTGPSGSIPLIDIADGSHFDRAGVATPGSKPAVTVTSALVTRSTVQLDGALLEASAPLFALTQAMMTTTSHFADLAGNKNPSMVLGDALVALNASKLTIENGNLLNLNAATATVNGFLFSLTNGSTLTLNKGALFSLNNGSSLNLTANAFGVFGSGDNMLTIENNLCTATCFQLVNSANQPILLDGTPLKVAGATENVVLPDNFNVFALAPGATASNAKIDIDANDALFRVDGTSTLTINGTTVVAP